MLKDKLEIILITYNRKAKLQKTFDQIFAGDSPIKDLQITILDNKSTDGSSELIEEYRGKFPNIKHVIHNRNIGGNANIARAFEAASFEYVWILCDDDFYNWENWPEIAQAILEEKYDLIYTTKNLIRDRSDISQLLHQATFVPGCIYSSKRITDCIQNIYASLYTMFSQVMISAEILVNNPGPYFVPSADVVLRLYDEAENESSLIRGWGHTNIFQPYERNFWHIGYINAIQIIKDKTIRNYVIEKTRFNDNFDQPFIDYLSFIFDYNKYYRNNNIYNLVELFLNISFRQKLSLAFVILKNLKIVFYTTEKGLYVELFFKLKIKLIPFKNKRKAVELCQK